MWRVLWKTPVPQPQQRSSLTLERANSADSRLAVPMRCFSDRLMRRVRDSRHSLLALCVKSSRPGFHSKYCLLLLAQLTTHVPRNRLRCSPPLTIDVENACGIEPCRPVCSSFWHRWCASRRALALSPAAGVEAVCAHPMILRRSSVYGLRESYRARAAVAEDDRSASRPATAPDDLHNEDPRSHLTTATGERCPCAM